MTEIEIRAKLNKAIASKLIELGVFLNYETDEVDDYFRFDCDTQRKMVIRIRERSEKILLTFKGSSKQKEDIAWQEWETEIQDPEALKKLFLSNGMVHITRIEKHRKSFSLGKFEINVDNIKGLGCFIEVEVISDDVPTARSEIESVMTRLGISKEQFITRGYVQLMLESLGRTRL